MKEITSRFAANLFVLLVVSFISVESRFQSTACVKYPAARFDVFDVESCHETDDCFLEKGDVVRVDSWSFRPISKSKTLRLSILVGTYDTDLKRQIESEIEFDESDLCEMEMFRDALLAKQSNTNTDRWECDLQVSQLYQLPAYNFYLPRLLPPGSVNITIALMGQNGMLACSVFHAVLLE